MTFFSSIEFYILAALFFARAMLVLWRNSRPQSPVLLMADRWLRLAFFAAAIACILKFVFNFESDYVCAAIGALAFFGGDSFFLWLQIGVASFSEREVFGKYVECDTAWRADKPYIELKRKIENSGFEKSASFKMKIDDEDEVLLTFFDSLDSKTRLAVSFVPFGSTGITLAEASSVDTEGRVIRTVASIIPFGFVYPKNYDVKRYPLISNPITLLKKHESHIADREIKPIKISPKEFLDTEIAETEKASRDAGLLNSRADEEDFGKFTSEGKSRIWREMIGLFYFPFLMD